MVIRALTPFYMLGQDSVRAIFKRLSSPSRRLTSSFHPPIIFNHFPPPFLPDVLLPSLPQGFPTTNYNVNSDTGNLHVNARTSAHTTLIKQIANAAAVLLKNTNNALPLSATNPPAKLAIIGQDAANQTSCSLNACDDGTLSVGYVKILYLTSLVYFPPLLDFSMLIISRP